jgi:hypothetical protein
VWGGQDDENQRIWWGFLEIEGFVGLKNWYKETLGMGMGGLEWHGHQAG